MNHNGQTRSLKCSFNCGCDRAFIYLFCWTLSGTLYSMFQVLETGSVRAHRCTYSWSGRGGCIDQRDGCTARWVWPPSGRPPPLCSSGPTQRLRAGRPPETRGLPAGVKGQVRLEPCGLTTRHCVCGGYFLTASILSPICSRPSRCAAPPSMILVT